MNFQEAYKQLEDNFRHQVEEDRKLGIESIFLPNMVPKAPADYVLIGPERPEAITVRNVLKAGQ